MTTSGIDKNSSWRNRPGDHGQFFCFESSITRLDVHVYNRQRNKLGHFKDLKLINAQITRIGVISPMTEVAIEEYARTVENGEGQKDFSVIALETQCKNGLA